MLHTKFDATRAGYLDLGRASYDAAAYDPAIYDSAYPDQGLYNSAYEAALYGTDAAGGSRHPHAYAQAPGSMPWIPNLGFMPEDIEAQNTTSKDEGVEILQALFPNTRISVISGNQTASAPVSAGGPRPAPTAPPHFGATPGSGGLLGSGGGLLSSVKPWMPTLRDPVSTMSGVEELFAGFHPQPRGVQDATRRQHQQHSPQRQQQQHAAAAAAVASVLAGAPGTMGAPQHAAAMGAAGTAGPSTVGMVAARGPAEKRSGGNRRKS